MFVAEDPIAFMVAVAFGLAVCVALPTAALTAVLVKLLMPLMRRYAMARPTARGLHTTPTPQGGGLAIMLAIAVVCATLPMWLPHATPRDMPMLWRLLAAASLLAALGALDDIYGLSARLRLVVQFFAVVLAWWGPWPFQAAQAGFYAPLLVGALASVGLVWFVNLTNFMDGMDGMTVVGLGVPALFAACALVFTLDRGTDIAAFAAVGGLIGFFPFNKPRAALFLGDVGSLSLGLIVGVAFARLGLGGHPVAALIAPLYYLADATITLFLRWRRGENLAQAHRSHFYQRAVTGGMSAWGVLARVGALNAALAALASLALFEPDWRWQGAALLAAVVLVGLTLRRLARGA